LTPADKRASLIQACKKANIDLRPFFNGLSSMPAFRRFARVCPVSAELSASGVNLPTLRKVDMRVAEKIADIFRQVLDYSMIPKRPAPDAIRGGYRFSEEIMLQHEVRAR
jgi:perosamine synthetase